MSIAIADDDLGALGDELSAAIVATDTPEALEAVRVAALGKAGRVTALLKTLGALPPEARRTRGAEVNTLRDRVTAEIEARRAVLEAAALDARLAAEVDDITLPVRPGPMAEGRIHPLTQMTDELTAICAALGFALAEGPDIETDDNNFTKLNFPPGHPARETHDTFFFPAGDNGERLLLRTHTSTVQVRHMLANQPPIRIVAPGRVYRNDSDQTHTPMFHQLEALVIDETAHLGHLKWLIGEICRAVFEVDELRIRLRASHFPFTEPSLEVDIGAEAIGKPGAWLEIGGAGMVHPNVLSNCGIDPESYQGFAFGFGIDRMAMLKYGIADLRQFFAGDARWLRHYGFAPLSLPSIAAGLSG